jgi:hypothetical protein
VNILGERYSYIYLFVTQSHSFPRFCQLHVLVDCTILPVQYGIVQSSPTYPYPSACNHTISASKFRSPTSSEPVPLHNAHIATVHAVLCLDFSIVPSASTFPGVRVPLTSRIFVRHEDVQGAATCPTGLHNQYSSSR